MIIYYRERKPRNNKIILILRTNISFGLHRFIFSSFRKLCLINDHVYQYTEYFRIIITIITIESLFFFNEIKFSFESFRKKFNEVQE